MIVEAYSPRDLAAKVTGFIMEGWKPQGGVSIGTDERVALREFYLQAMTQ